MIVYLEIVLSINIMPYNWNNHVVCNYQFLRYIKWIHWYKQWEKSILRRGEDCIPSILTHPLVLVIALTKTIRIMETIMWFCWFFVSFCVCDHYFYLAHYRYSYRPPPNNSRCWAQNIEKQSFLLSFGNFSWKLFHLA